MEDMEWALETLLWEIGFMGGCPGAYERYLYEQMTKKNGLDRPSWQALSLTHRAVVVSHAIDRLLGDTRIVAVETENTKVGKRCFRIANILLTLVTALDDDDQSELDDAACD